MRNRSLWSTAAWVVASAFASLAIWFSNFWPLFLFPAILFLLLQQVALRHWKHKETLFKFTDYVYYLLIGGVVALGSRFLLQAEQVAALNSILETQVLQQRLREIDAELPELRLAREKVQRSQDAADPRFVAECQAQQLAKQFTRPDKPKKPEVLQIDPCAGYLSSLDNAIRLPIKIASLESERASTSKRLQDVPSSFNTSSTSARGRDPRRMEIEFLWAPTLLLAGIAIKLGKTTFSLCPIPR